MQKDKRAELHEELAEILGSRNVYFQPPAEAQLACPCIIYTLAKVNNKHADDITYKRNFAFKVTLIHSDPDNVIVDKLMDMKYSEFDTSFKTQGRNHYVFTIYK